MQMMDFLLGIIVEPTREVFDLQSPTGVAECAELEITKVICQISKSFRVTK